VKSAVVEQLVVSYISKYSFPNYNLLDTNLPATQTNLTANFTAWNVVSNRDLHAVVYRDHVNTVGLV
jgi:hypothetical protein